MVYTYHDYPFYQLVTKNDKKIKETWYDENGYIHNFTGPAIVEYNDNGDQVCRMYFIRGIRHRINGPAYEYEDSHNKIYTYYINGNIHRDDDEPAHIHYVDNELIYETYYMHGDLHRENGPAYRFRDEYRYYIYGVLHREDGPAVIKGNKKRTYVHGNCMQDGRVLVWESEGSDSE